MAVDQGCWQSGRDGGTLRRYTRLVALGPIFAASALLAVGLPDAGVPGAVGATLTGASRAVPPGLGMPRVTVPGSHPAWATRSRQVSAAAAGPVRLQLHLAGRDQAGMTAFSTAVSTPGSPSYRKFLSPVQVLRRFGPDQAQVRLVSAWLHSAGLRVTSVQASGAAGAYVAAAGSLAAAGRYHQPAYQAGVVPTRLATHLPDGKVSPVPMRVIPDVSAVADLATGLLVGQTTLQPNGRSYVFSLAVVGGTSLACPVFAGIEADAQQAAGHVFGFANPLIYSRYGTSAFHDVTDHPLGPGIVHVVGNAFITPSLDRGPFVTLLNTLGINGEGAAALRAVPGYDDATGVGSPNRYIQSFGQ